MSIKNKFEKWFYLDDEEKEVQEQPRREEQRPVQEQPRRAPMRKQIAGEPQQSATVVSLQSVQKSSKVILIEPLGRVGFDV